MTLSEKIYNRIKLAKYIWVEDVKEFIKDILTLETIDKETREYIEMRAGKELVE